MYLIILRFRWLFFCILSISLFVSTPSYAQNKSKTKAQSSQKLNSFLSPKQQMGLHTEDLRNWMLSLYLQYPDELAKSTQVGASEMVEWVFEGKNNWKFEALRSQQGQDALALWFDENYLGDRILALVVGFESMLFKAYGAENEYAIPQVVSEQGLMTTVCDLRQWQYRLLNQQPENQTQSTNSFLNNPSFKEGLDSVVMTITHRIESNVSSKVVCGQ